jgi:hypothetical protein
MRQVFSSSGNGDPVDAYGRLAALGPGRPRVRAEHDRQRRRAASLQGRSGTLGGPADKALFATLRSLAAVVLMSAGTMRPAGCLTAAPLLTAGQARRILDGAALAPSSMLELGHVLEADGYLFLRYRRR